MKQITLLLAILFWMPTIQAQKSVKLNQLIFNEQYDLAIPILLQKIKQDNNSSESYFQLGKIYQILQQDNKAIDHFKKAHNISPNSIAILLGLSKSLYACGRYPETEKHLIKLISLDSTHHQANLLLAKTYLSQSSYNESLEIYSKLVKNDSLNPNLHKQLGNVKDRLQDYIGSLASYLKAYELNQADLSVIIHIIQKLYEMQAYEQALEYANKGLEIYPENHLILKKKAQCLVGLEWYENALNLFQDLNKRKLLNLNGIKQLGICYMQTRQYEQAITHFLTCITTSENGVDYGKDPMLNFYLGVCYSRLDDNKTGIIYLERAIEYITSPITSSIHLYLAKAYSSTKSFDKAVSEYLKHIELDSSNPEVLYEIATTYEEFGDNKQKALKYYSRYIRETDDIGGERYEYAKSRILHIKEKIHFEK